MGLMKRLRTAETNGYDLCKEGRAIIKANKAEQALRAWQAQSGPPEPPQANTGFYRCDGGYYRVGTGPWPEYQPYPATPKPYTADDAWTELEQAVDARRESGKPYTVDDAWDELNLARKALAKEAVSSFLNGAPPPPKPKRTRGKQRTDGLTQGSLF